jgi:hemolysin D
MSLKHRIQAYRELLRHYTDVFAHFWRDRAKLDGGIFREHEAEFLPSALSLQKKPVSPAARLVARALMALVLAVLAWSVLGQVDIIVNATGKVIPSSRTKTIASVDVASVRALHVEEGQTVTAGDLLIELDTSASDAERNKAQGDEIMEALQVARSKALIKAVETSKPPVMEKMDNVPPDRWQAEKDHLDGQYRDFQAKLKRIDGDIKRYRQALPLATRKAKDYKELARDHDVSTHDYMEKEQDLIDLQGQLRDARNQRASLIAETTHDAYDALSEGKKTGDASEQDALRAESHSKLLQLTAPVDGTVQQLTVHTVGGVVPAAQPLMLIVPKESVVEVEASLENKDIGFVEEGQPAEVKIDAFEYSKYGTIPGHVMHVSRDAIQDEKKGLVYSTIIALDKTSILVEGKEMPLSPGMSVSVEVKTGTRRVIEYVLSPLLQHKRESLNER